jgi:hypothetical protein
MRFASEGWGMAPDCTHSDSEWGRDQAGTDDVRQEAIAITEPFLQCPSLVLLQLPLSVDQGPDTVNHCLHQLNLRFPWIMWWEDGGEWTGHEETRVNSEQLATGWVSHREPGGGGVREETACKYHSTCTCNGSMLQVSHTYRASPCSRYRTHHLRPERVGERGGPNAPST